MSASASTPRVVFAHGKESGPWGSKITRLADAARALGFTAESLDYQGLDDPAARLTRLCDHAPKGAPLVLAGSSMGGYVSAMACDRLAPDALFLMAPALYMPGYPGEPAGCPSDIEIVHGWHDDIVPVTASLRFGESRAARVHLLPDGHRLSESLEAIEALFRAQLARVAR
ncbi:alpha/beta fold hydrolase [Salinisphaera sp. Q1T1-3]|uniref:alpha/beta fold hydrolase n=1 Tax=Salinisphaera sp. Q1T1-3 TaxID=2321229 RepID=UPI000E7624D6|nr:alpha/beta fold hydrolase [Salinisphaera sp. Q1T1-3]RJS95039.1 alpha/beta hydrolase [Salinisphaera sp. Q1T1-3]